MASLVSNGKSIYQLKRCLRSSQSLHWASTLQEMACKKRTGCLWLLSTVMHGCWLLHFILVPDLDLIRLTGIYNSLENFCFLLIFLPPLRQWSWVTFIKSFYKVGINIWVVELNLILFGVYLCSCALKILVCCLTYIWQSTFKYIEKLKWFIST